MKLFFYSAWIFCFFCLSAFAEEEILGELDRVLRNAHIGVTFNEFISVHPEAVYSDIDIRDMPVSLERPGALLLSHDSDPFLGMASYANIGFREGTLYELVAVWNGESSVVKNMGGRFFAAAISRHGQTYLRKTILVYPHTAEERPVAVAMWQESDAAILAFYTPASSTDAPSKATLTYAQFMPDDLFLKDIFEKNLPTAEQQEEAWLLLESIMPVLEVGNGTQQQP
ncbi:MAG: hypothetical protein KAH38_06540 [Candidatus Hydrogenedentes bacterium]|nr:hypothetical protein [Candidatus Hydrogenedentota bacterium]